MRQVKVQEVALVEGIHSGNDTEIQWLRNARRIRRQLQQLDERRNKFTLDVRAEIIE